MSEKNPVGRMTAYAIPRASEHRHVDELLHTGALRGLEEVHVAQVVDVLERAVVFLLRDADRREDDVDALTNSLESFRPSDLALYYLIQRPLDAI
jgi:hypothetical protein